jgi:subtilase family serine protease
MVGLLGLAALSLAAPSLAVPAHAAVPEHAVAAPAARTVTAPTRYRLPRDVRPAACQAVKPGDMSCMALVRTNLPKGYRPYRDHGLRPLAEGSSTGYGPNDLQSAYNLISASASKGNGETVAVVDANDDPNAESDLAAYRSYFGLTPCTTANGCFTKVNQYGGQGNPPSVDAGWAGEISLDLDMVSAICPNCHILLVEANSSSPVSLGESVNEAVTLGAKFISNSYGSTFLGSPYEYPGETVFDSYYDHPGVAVTASAGDGGYGVEYPAASENVTAVGGTSLLQATNSRNWAEIAWSGTGSGCSSQESKPSWQTDTGCSMRTVADVSAVADPNTGVAVYDSYGTSTDWHIYGGTSASAPIIAAVYALAGTPAAGSYPAGDPYAHKSALYDITAGTNTEAGCSPSYLCTAGVGYDGPTGLGTPDGTGAF